MEKLNEHCNCVYMRVVEKLSYFSLCPARGRMFAVIVVVSAAGAGAVDAGEIICDFMLGRAYLLIFWLLLHMEQWLIPNEARETPARHVATFVAYFSTFKEPHLRQSDRSFPAKFHAIKSSIFDTKRRRSQGTLQVAGVMQLGLELLSRIMCPIWFRLPGPPFSQSAISSVVWSAFPFTTWLFQGTLDFERTKPNVFRISRMPLAKPNQSQPEAGKRPPSLHKSASQLQIRMQIQYQSHNPGEHHPRRFGTRSATS